MPCEMNLPNTKDNEGSDTPAKVCRLCLDPESPLFNMSKLQIEDSIRLLTGFKIHTDDGLPQYVCGCCRHFVIKFMMFRKRCLIAHDVLKSAIELKVEITTDLIRAIDRAALNLKLPFVVANDFIDCLNKDDTDKIVSTLENATELSFEPLDTTHEVDNIDNQPESPKSEINISNGVLELMQDENNYTNNDKPIVIQDEINCSDDQFRLAKNEIIYSKRDNQSQSHEKINNHERFESLEKGMDNVYLQVEPSENRKDIFKILMDVCTSEAEQLKKSNNINISVKDKISKDVKNLRETLDCAAEATLPLDQSNNTENDKSDTQAEALKSKDITQDVCTGDCNLSYNEIISIKLYDKLIDKEESLLCDSELDEEPEVLPAVKISKDTKVSLDIKLTPHDKNCLEKFLMKHYRFKEIYSEEKACLLDRVKQVLEYNDSELVKVYDENKTGSYYRKNKKIFVGNYLWVSSEKKRAEFEEKFDTKINMLTKEQQIEEFKARALSPAYQRKLYKCVICFLGFMAEKPYMLHMNVHNPMRGKFECDICSYRFGGLVKYREHVLLHKYKFNCNKCNYTTNSLCTAKEHYKWHIGHRHICKYCNKVFSGKSTYFAHMKYRHPSQLLSCDYCGEVFLGRVGLKLHMSKDHEVAGVSSRLSKCTTCGVKFMSVKAMNNHLSSWDDGVCQPEIKSCVECGDNFENEDLLLFHSTVHQKNYGCDLCELSFFDESSLNVHYQRKHLNVNKRVRVNPVYLKNPVTVKRDSGKDVKRMCEYCGKYMLKYHLKDHINEHLGIKPYSCDLCSKSFHNKYALKPHMITHTNVRQYKCDLCGMTFQNAGNLKRHQDVHTGIKRFECEICQKRFGSKGSVHTHIKHVHLKIPVPPRVRKRRIEVKTSKMELESTNMEVKTANMEVETAEMEFETAETNVMTEVVEDMSWMPDFY